MSFPKELALKNLGIFYIFNDTYVYIVQQIIKPDAKFLNLHKDISALEALSKLLLKATVKNLEKKVIVHV